jgi:uncharacterized protein (DUF4415 family)
MKAIQSWDDVPTFATEDAEAAFWATHDTGKRLLDQMQPIPPDGGGEFPPARAPVPSARTRPVSVRLDDDVLSRLKALAARKKKGYQTLLKEFVVERVYEEEKREGIIPGRETR